MYVCVVVGGGGGGTLFLNIAMLEPLLMSALCVGFLLLFLLNC